MNIVFNYSLVRRLAQNEFTLLQLARYNGKGGSPAYVAVSGIVYDVTKSDQWKNGIHFGLQAGRDLTGDFAACHQGQPLNLPNITRVGTLRG